MGRVEHSLTNLLIERYSKPVDCPTKDDVNMALNSFIESHRKHLEMRSSIESGTALPAVDPNKHTITFCSFQFEDARVAQPVERRTCNADVGGSKPPVGSNVNESPERAALRRIAERLRVKVTPEMTSVEIANKIAVHDKGEKPSEELRKQWNERLRNKEC